jgi:hypothetical protein
MYLKIKIIFILALLVGIICSFFTVKQFVIAPTLAYTEPVPVDPLIAYPELKRIAVCESGGRQFNDDGTVLAGVVNPLDRGRFQINAFYHRDTANSLGFDIETEEGNIAYAKWLYNKEGAKPWLASFACHGVE